MDLYKDNIRIIKNYDECRKKKIRSGRKSPQRDTLGPWTKANPWNLPIQQRDEKIEPHIDPKHSKWLGIIKKKTTMIID